MTNLHQTELFKSVYPFAWLYDAHSAIVSILQKSPENEELLRDTYGNSIDALNRNVNRYFADDWERPNYEPTDYELKSVLGLVQGFDVMNERNRMYHSAMGSYLINQSFVGKMSYLIDLYFGYKTLVVPVKNEGYAVAKKLLLKAILLADAVVMGNLRNVNFMYLSAELLEAKGLKHIQLERLGVFESKTFISLLPKINPKGPELDLMRDTEKWIEDQLAHLRFELNIDGSNTEVFPMYAAIEKEACKMDEITGRLFPRKESRPELINQVVGVLEKEWKEYQNRKTEIAATKEEMPRELLADISIHLANSDGMAADELKQEMLDYCNETLKAPELVDKLKSGKLSQPEIRNIIVEAIASLQEEEVKENTKKLQKLFSEINEKKGLDKAIDVLFKLRPFGPRDHLVTQDQYFQKAMAEGVFVPPPPF